MRIAVVIHELDGLSVHRLIEDVAVAGSRRKVLAKFFLNKSLVVPNRYRMRVIELDAHALERNGVPRRIGHVVGVARDLNVLEYLTYGDGQAAIAPHPNRFGISLAVFRNHLGGDHDRHVVFGERVGINKHRMVAGKEYGLEIGLVKRLFRQLVDLGVIGERQPAAQVSAGEAGVAKRFDRRIALEPCGGKARATSERASAKRCNGSVLVQTGIGQSLAVLEGSDGKRREADNLVEPRRHQSGPGKSSLAYRTDGSSLVDIQARKRLAAIERLFSDLTDGHTGEADIGKIRTVIEGVHSNYRNGSVLKAHRTQIGRVGTELYVDFIHPVIDNQICYHSTVDRVPARAALINLHRKISVCVARIQIEVRHELGVLVGRLLQVTRGIRDIVRIAIVIHQLYGFSVHRAIEDVAVAGSRRKVLAEFFL